ncbi:MAG: protein kinase [Bacteroidota bacterium]
MKYRKDDIFAGRYKLVKHLGTGGFAEVWKAEDVMADNSIVAIKIFAPDKGLDEDGVLVFRREYALTLPLRHNHLLTASYFDINDGSPYLIMPFCEAGSLMSKIVRHHEFSEEEIAKVMAQLTDGLTYLHENGITHQDMKPDNVMILKPGYYVLADFGISTRIRRSVARSMRADQAKSYSAFTPAYAPPEKYISKPTPAGDIFSFGVTIYECLTGDVPFEDMGAALERGATIPDLPEKYSKGLNDLLQKCMSTKPGDRPTAREVADTVNAFKKTGIWPLSGNADAVEKADKPIKKPRKTMVMSAIELDDDKEEKADIQKTAVATKPAKKEEEKKRAWLIPALIGAVLLLGTAAGYNIWSSGQSKRLAKEEALQKENFTKSFFQNMIDSTSDAASVEALAFLLSRVDFEKDSGSLFDEQHFDFEAFERQWNNRQQTLFTIDSISRATAYQDSLDRAKAIADSLALVEQEKEKPDQTEPDPPTDNTEEDDDFTLPSLEEIQRKIKQKGHYPRISTSILFKINSSVIKPEAYPLMDALATRLKEVKAPIVEIGVHTDAMGSSKYNKILSQKRADAIEKYLVRKGVSDGKLSAVGYGEDKPIDTNESARGRAMNRRVEIAPKKQ